MKARIYLIIMCLYSCNLFTPEKVDERIRVGFAETDSLMMKDYANARDTFNMFYEVSIRNSKDSLTLVELEIFHSALLQSINYLDSLKVEMYKLDKSEIKNVDLINKIFLKNSIADSLFNKMKLYFIMAEKISKTPEIKSEIRESRLNIMNEPDINQRKNQYFEFNNSIGIIMMFYAFETEQLRVGIKSLKGYY